MHALLLAALLTFAPRVASPAPPWTGMSTVEFVTFCWQDQARADRDVHRLAYSPVLAESAHEYAVELGARGVLTHDLDGTTPVSRAEADGYPSAYVGENAAMGQRSPAEVTGDWINSPHHLENIVNPNYTEMGVGVVVDAHGRAWWVVDFGNPTIP